MTRRLLPLLVIALVLAGCGLVGPTPNADKAAPQSTSTSASPVAATPSSQRPQESLVPSEPESSSLGSSDSRTTSGSAEPSSTTPGSATPGPGSTAPGPGSTAPSKPATTSADVTVPATQEWTDTGLDVAHWVGIRAEGTIDVGGPEGNLTPAGSATGCTTGPTSFSGMWLANGYPCWSLIARVGDGPPFRVGTGGDFLVSSGRLFLGVDDERGQYGDNSGSWDVSLIAPEGPTFGSAPLFTMADVIKGLRCGASAGLDKLETLGPDAKDLYDAIGLTLAEKDFVDNEADLVKASVMLGLGLVPGPWTDCFKEFFFDPTPAGAGEAPPPTGLTVKADPQDPHSLLLTWTPAAADVFGYQVHNGDSTRSTPGTVSTDPVTFTWTGLAASQYMCFRVRATTGDAFSDWHPSTPPYYRCATSSAAP